MLSFANRTPSTTRCHANPLLKVLAIASLACAWSNCEDASQFCDDATSLLQVWPRPVPMPVRVEPVHSAQKDAEFQALSGGPPRPPTEMELFSQMSELDKEVLRNRKRSADKKTAVTNAIDQFKARIDQETERAPPVRYASIKSVSEGDDNFKGFRSFPTPEDPPIAGYIPALPTPSPTKAVQLFLKQEQFKNATKKQLHSEYLELVVSNATAEISAKTVAEMMKQAEADWRKADEAQGAAEGKVIAKVKDRQFVDSMSVQMQPYTNAAGNAAEVQANAMQAPPAIQMNSLGASGYQGPVKLPGPDGVTPYTIVLPSNVAGAKPAHVGPRASGINQMPSPPAVMSGYRPAQYQHLSGYRPSQMEGNGPVLVKSRANPHGNHARTQENLAQTMMASSMSTNNAQSYLGERLVTEREKEDKESGDRILAFKKAVDEAAQTVVQATASKVAAEKADADKIADENFMTFRNAVDKAAATVLKTASEKPAAAIMTFLKAEDGLSSFKAAVSKESAKYGQQVPLAAAPQAPQGPAWATALRNNGITMAQMSATNVAGHGPSLPMDRLEEALKAATARNRVLVGAAAEHASASASLDEEENEVGKANEMQHNTELADDQQMAWFADM